ncbi:MAG TPA: class I fructose-bisphosphate aldolase [Gammaproteobacteria bacterium]|jgi:fructose-bisphosphate aldolase class I|nr:class I fructose-bisphosphate aldolase [Gammaproteobacteria bacterium]
MNLQELSNIAHKLVANNRGILAADESTSTIEKRFKSIGVENTEENRRAYREMLFATPGAEKFISGVIMYDETIRQKTKAGVPFPELQAKLGIVPGIKVDKGVKELAGSPQEKITEGLDGLRERLQEYHKLGARFAKWRGVIDIGAGIPTAYCIRANAQALARYAALCQEQGIVPIVEPEVLMDGAHDIGRCFAVTSETLKIVFEELANHRVALEGMLLKPNMVISGMKSPSQASVQDVARETVMVLKRHVPAAVPGVVFLSGGQSDVVATEHLQAMNALGQMPWILSFSYGRALQAAALEAWHGKESNLSAGQKAFHHRAQCNSAACAATYDAKLEKAA